MQAPRLILLATLAAVAGCAKPAPPPVVTPPPPLPPHLGPPPAAACSVAPFKVSDGGTAEIAMQVSSEGGYCAATLTAASGAPFDAPLVPDRPAHGAARVVKYNGRTSIEYAPLAGYAGADRFTVELIVKNQPGYTTLHVGVLVGSSAKN